MMSWFWLSPRGRNENGSPVAAQGWVATLLALTIGAVLSLSSRTASQHPIPVLIFTAANCPHCVEGVEFLRAMADRQRGLQIREYEIWGHPENVELLLDLCRTFGRETFTTPAIFIDDRVWFGFSPAMSREIETAVGRCAVAGCPDPLARLSAPKKSEGRPLPPPRGPEAIITLPILGPVAAEDLSLPVLTVLFGLLDSFNPCAFFVLLFLLGLLLHAHSRRRMLLVGGTFVFFSGAIYFLFMAAWLNLFLLVGEMPAITVLAGLTALVVGGLNLKDFFFFRRGVSLSIPESVKPRLFDRMRRLVRATRLSSVLAGTVVLAMAANSYEILCTAGFPMVYTRALTLHDLPRWQFYAFVAFYNLVYILPLLAIVLLFTFTLGGRKLTERQGRVLKLVSGMMMLLLGGVLLVRPGWLNNPGAAVLLLAAALLGSILIVLVSRAWERRRSRKGNE
jgi:glutaredoxin